MTVVEHKSDFELTIDISASWVSYVVYIVRIWEEIDCIIMAVHCSNGKLSIYR